MTGPLQHLTGPSQQHPKVAAVIVTYNRADKLHTVIKHVLAQDRPVDHLVIVDNASTDHTAEVIAEVAGLEQVQVHRSAVNTGGAGGFATGMQLAYSWGADLVWIMDDDCYAQPAALDRLCAGLARAEQLLGEGTPGERVAFAGSLVQWRDGSICMMNSPPASDDWAELIVRGAPITLVDLCSFVSVLIPRWALEAYGLPLREYFIWFDDAEYTRRIGQGGRGIQVHDSVVLHDLAENKGVNFAHVDAASLWKFRYGARNESSYLWHHRGAVHWLEFVLLTAVRMRRGKVAWRYRAVIAGRILAGLRFDPKPERVS
jgi:GT2 family glycosyltransferase